MSTNLDRKICVYCGGPAENGICDRCLEEGETMMPNAPVHRRQRRRFLFTDPFARSVVGQPVMDEQGNVGLVKVGTGDGPTIKFVVLFGERREVIDWQTCKIWRRRFQNNNEKAK